MAALAPLAASRRWISQLLHCTALPQHGACRRWWATDSLCATRDSCCTPVVRTRFNTMSDRPV
ncbi:hypothetical protein PR001_g20609 [Phytophthora rubi]|uniref:Uncharacterized protein n=1 Tax=Phytophthora rubi TaxID=129364 RepID=A0A6A3JJH8_9STRA|nr:hypothetical protein PR001_g20609 [Phytophthora rubi]